MNKAAQSVSRTRLPPEERQREILNAARKVFETRGYESWTVADIAKEVGVVEGTVLHYFKSKNNLVAKVIEQFYAGITEVMEQGVQRVTGVRERLRFVIYTHTQLLFENAALCSLMLKEAREAERELGIQIYELSKRYTQVVTDIVNEGKKTSEIADSVSSRMIRHVLFGAMEHYLWDLIFDRSSLDVNDIADELTDIVYFGIAYRADSGTDPEIRRLVLQLRELVG